MKFDHTKNENYLPDRKAYLESTSAFSVKIKKTKFRTKYLFYDHVGNLFAQIYTYPKAKTFALALHKRYCSRSYMKRD